MSLMPDSFRPMLVAFERGNGERFMQHHVLNIGTERLRDVDPGAPACGRFHAIKVAYLPRCNWRELLCGDCARWLVRNS